jgi:hypothetical protein
MKAPTPDDIARYRNDGFSKRVLHPSVVPEQVDDDSVALAVSEVISGRHCSTPPIRDVLPSLRRRLTRPAVALET